MRGKGGKEAGRGEGEGRRRKGKGERKERQKGGSQLTHDRVFSRLRKMPLS